MGLFGLMELAVELCEVVCALQDVVALGILALAKEAEEQLQCDGISAVTDVREGFFQLVKLAI